MNLKNPVAIALLLTLFFNNCESYETETHALITRAAWARSALNNTGAGSLLERLGLDRSDPTAPFNVYWGSVTDSIPYYYTDGSGINSNSWIRPNTFERCQMQEFLGPEIPIENRIFGDTVDDAFVLLDDNLLPIQNWLVRGAIREDDLGPSYSNAYSVLTGFPAIWAASRENCGNFLNMIAYSEPLGIIRPLNHFYDPFLDIALLSNDGVPTSGNIRSVNWALGYVDTNLDGTSPQVDPNRQHYSYTDARNTFWLALTRQQSKAASNWAPPYTDAQRQSDSIDRLNLWATTFRSLGDLVHLLEDTAQPQHTRNDAHSALNSPEQQSFESYTNARVLNGGDVGAYVTSFPEGTSTLTPPPLGKYPIVNFSTPLRFFTTRADNANVLFRSGLADYTNRSFFTGGTLPGTTNIRGTKYPEPLPLESGSYTAQKVACEGLQGGDARLISTTAVTCTHYTSAIFDSVVAYNDLLPTGFSAPPLVSDSVFRVIIDNDLPGQSGIPSIFESHRLALGVAELDTTGNITIPRAIGYAAGMINFFFRGTLLVTPPSSGIYAILDHGTPHTVDSAGIPVCSQTIQSPIQGQGNLCTQGNTFGFTALTLNVKNANWNLQEVESGTALPIDQSTGGDGAKMVAIARYHRNPCYQKDLSGERAQDPDGVTTYTPSCPSFRTAYPDISVSAEVPVSAGMLDGVQPVAQTFDFSNDPIPINATDVFIQVAYRGPLGDETDGIAVGIVDVSEPTYDGDLAMTDLPLQYQEDGATWKWDPWTSPPWSAWTLQNGASWALPPPDPVADLAVSRIEICDNGTQLYVSSANQQLPEDHSVRIATLRDFSTHTVTSEVTFQGQFAGPSSIGTYTRINGGDVDQTDDEMGDGGLFTYQPYIRGVIAAPTYAYIYTCPTPLNVRSQCPVEEPPADNLVPSPSTQPAIPAPNGGFISENIGQVNTPGTVSCTIQGNYLPYAIRPRPAVTGHAASMSGRIYRSGQ